MVRPRSASVAAWIGSHYQCRKCMQYVKEVNNMVVCEDCALEAAASEQHHIPESLERRVKAAVRDVRANLPDLPTLDFEALLQAVLDEGVGREILSALEQGVGSIAWTRRAEEMVPHV